MTDTKKPNLYQLYLVLDMLERRLEALGLETMYRMLPDSGRHISMKISYWNGKSGAYLGPEWREAKVEEWLSTYTDGQLKRTTDSYQPEMVIYGTTTSGITWEVNFDSGVCEKVQVGTKTVEIVDPEVYAALPKITVDEPVFEFRCVDPLAALTKGQ